MKNVKLGTLGDIFIGLTYRPDDVSANGTVVLRSSNIQEGQLDFADTIRVNCKIRENLFVKENDILMCSRNGSAKLVGKCTLIPKLNEDMTFGAFMTIIRTSHNAYLQHFFNSTAFRTQIKGSATTTINQITRKMLDDIDVPIFDTNEEKHIVETFDKLTHLIALRTEQLKKLDELVKSRFIEMFGEVETNIKGFPMKIMEECCKFIGGAQPDKSHFEYEKTDENIRLIQIRDYKSDRFITYIPKSLARKTCTSSDIMIGRYGPPIFQILGGIEGAYNVALMKAIPTDEFNVEYFRCFLKNEKLLRYLESFSQRTAGQDGIQIDKLNAYPCFVPPIELQNEFATFVEQTDKLKFEVKEALEKLEILKKSLMQQYFG